MGLPCRILICDMLSPLHVALRLRTRLKCVESSTLGLTTILICKVTPECPANVQSEGNWDGHQLRRRKHSYWFPLEADCHVNKRHYNGQITSIYLPMARREQG